MNISCTQENLSRGIASVSRIIGVRGTLPILSHVQLSTDKGRLKIAGTDLEIGIISYIGAKIDEEGAVTVPARLLGEFVNANHDQTIQLQVVGTKVTASSEHVQAHLNGLNASDFPLIPEVDQKNALKLGSKELKDAIAKVVFAVAMDESRPVLTGVSVKTKDKELILAATDSYRLAETIIPLTNAPSTAIEVIVPARTLQEVGRLLDSSDKEVTIAAATNQISFTFGTTTVVSRVLEGTFPDYDQIIPKAKTTSAVVLTSELSNALKLGSSFAREVANNIRLVVAPDEPIKVMATSPQVGDTTAKVEAEVTGDSLEIAFNAKFLLDVLAASQTDKVNIDFNGSMAPAVVTTVVKSPYRALVMPLLLDEN